MMETPARSTSRVVVPHAVRWHGRLAAGLITAALRSMAASLRFHVVDPIGLTTGGHPKNLIMITWHNRLALALSVYTRFIAPPYPGRRMAAMVSASRDGGLLARVLENFGVQPVRGSSSRRGPQALRELKTWADRGLDISLTPDGPRGPCYSMQDGVLALAQVTGIPIVTVAVNFRPKITLKSWDRFQVPIPLGRCEIVFGEPLMIPRRISTEDRAELRATLRERLLRDTRD